MQRSTLKEQFKRDSGELRDCRWRLVWIVSPWTVISGSLKRTRLSVFLLRDGSESTLLIFDLFRIEVGSFSCTTWNHKEKHWLAQCLIETIWSCLTVVVNLRPSAADSCNLLELTHNFHATWLRLVKCHDILTARSSRVENKLSCGLMIWLVYYA